jgi:hypothetical protein
MSYFVGTFQYFDNSFLYDVKDFQEPSSPTYEPGSFFDYLQKNHPKWFIIIEKAGRMNFFNNKNYTMFIPQEESIPDYLLVNMDRQYALALFNRHTIEGIYDRNVIETSKYQQVSTLVSGKTLLIVCYNNEIIIDGVARIIGHENQYDNVVAHIISNLLM